MASNNYAHIAALTAGTLLSPKPCELQNVNVNSLGASSNTLTLYDANAVASIGMAPVIAVFDTTKTPATYNYNVQCLNGLVAVVAAGTAGDVTICFR